MQKAKLPTATLLGLLGLLGLAGCATPPEQATPARTPQEAQRTTQLASTRQLLTATAAVARIDPAKREIVLRGNRGRLHPMRVDDSVRNLERFKPGDRVESRYYEALLLELEQRPSGRITERALSPQESEMHATVAAINQKTGKVTLRGQRDTITMKVAPDLNIRSLKTGERVRARYINALVLEIRPYSAPRRARARR